MKRWSTVLVALIALLLLSAAASYAIYPKPDGTITFTVSQGWYGPGIPVWYICTDASTIRYASTLGLRLSPNLSRGFYGAGVAAMFIVKNGVQTQGPIFETIPGQNLYSGIWRVREVTWIDKDAIVPLTSISQILALQQAGKLDYTETETRLDCPILMVGRLGIPTNSTQCLSYVIPQAISYSTTSKRITLPFWNAYCQNAITKAISVVKVIIPDAGTQHLAFDLKANYAPALQGWGNSQYQLDGTQRFLVFTGAQPPSQIPVLENCPPTTMISNSPYSPVGQYTILQRHIADSTVIKTPDVALTLFLHGGLTLVCDDQFINAPVVR